MSCPIPRTYPLRKPPNHKLPIPRFHHVLRPGVDHVYVAYIGIQKRSDAIAATEARAQAVRAIQSWLETGDGRPASSESFALVGGADQHGTFIWACYWDDGIKYESGLSRLPLPSVHQQLCSEGRKSIGLWLETFTAEDSRLETNYTGTEYRPGIAGLPGTTFTEHELATYWGAARDRIPDAANDLFPPEDKATIAIPDTPPRGLGQHLVGTNYDNLAHIRSGQLWENCGPEEAAAYENKLEPNLLAGLTYLWEHEAETGARALRYLRNEKIDEQEETRPPRKESCGAGFFTSLEALEKWSKTHRSHLAIYGAALAHYKAFPGELRRLRTWHEVCVLRAGAAWFEYVNCTARTGVVGTMRLEVRSDDIC